MIVVWIIVGAAGAVAMVEVTVWLAVRHFRPRFQWLITTADIAPPIPNDLLAKHVNGSFDPEIGWVPRPFAKGRDETTEQPKTYTIDALGRRTNPGFDRLESKIAVVGDSFAFCRMVDDDETWPHFLSLEFGTNVQNFGVGNYGIDQTLLRLEREISKGTVAGGVVVIVFTPESISRIHSYWRHFYEYGNILGFKPRFIVENDTLRLQKQAVTTAEGLAAYRERLPELMSSDPFYRSKFCKDLNRCPFSLRLITRWRRLPPILWHLSVGAFTGKRDIAYRRAIDVVLRENAREAARLYRDPSATDLLKRIVAKIAHVCRAAGADPIVAVIPQPVDIENGLVASPNYRRCIAELRQFVLTVDFAELLASEPDWRDLFTDGLRGPHFHARANRFVAAALQPYIEDALRHGGTGVNDAADNGPASGQNAIALDVARRGRSGSSPRTPVATVKHG